MKKLLYIFIAALCLVSCKEECVDCDFPPVLPTSANRVFLLYLAMDNSLSLSPIADMNIQELYSSAGKDALNGGVIYVLRDVPGENTQLICIFYDPVNRKTQKLTVKVYPTNIDTSKAETFQTVWNDVQDLISSESWGLGFGSHGFGWIPNSMFNKYGVMARSRAMVMGQEVATRNLMQDKNDVMEFQDFADAMPEHVDFIIMDLCYMGGVEFAYALSEKADYLVLSPAEVIDKGMPYNLIVDDIFATEPRLGAGGVSEEFYNFYNNYENPNGRYATVSLLDCSKFEPFVEATRAVLAHRDVEVDTYVPNLSAIQRFDRLLNPIMFDMREFVVAMANGQSVDLFDAALNDLVLYKNTTGKPLNNSLSIPKDRYSGLSTYIPVSRYNDLNQYYYETGWFQDVYQ